MLLILLVFIQGIENQPGGHPLNLHLFVLFCHVALPFGKEILFLFLCVILGRAVILKDVSDDFESAILDDLLIVLDPKVISVDSPLLEAPFQPFQIDLPYFVTSILAFVILLNESPYFGALYIWVFNTRFLWLLASFEE